MSSRSPFFRIPDWVGSGQGGRAQGLGTGHDKPSCSLRAAHCPQACAKRIEEDTTGEAHCTGQVRVQHPWQQLAF